MYQRVKERIVRRKVTINVPVEGDAFTQATIWVTWELAKTKVTDRRALDVPFFLEHTKNVEDYLEEDGKTPIPFSRETLEELLSDGFVLSAFMREYMACSMGAARGN